MIDLQKGARASDKFHLSCGEVTYTAWGWTWLFHSVTWHGIKLPDGSPARFKIWILGWKLRWYLGTAKIDGTRTRMYWNGELGDKGDPSCYVANTSSTEMWSLRFHGDSLDLYRWDNMAGI